MNYENPTPVAVAIVPVYVGEAENFFQDPCFTQHLKLLAIRRGTEPFIGGLAFPGGFIEKLEAAEAAAARELQEETGIMIPADQFKALATRVTPSNKLLIFCMTDTVLYHKTLTGFTPTTECLELVMVDENDTLCFPTHTDILQSIDWRY